jgi:hypothetical protein
MSIGKVKTKASKHTGNPPLAPVATMPMSKNEILAAFVNKIQVCFSF